MRKGDLVSIKGEAGIWKIRTIQQAVGRHHQEAALDRADDGEGRRFQLSPVADLTMCPADVEDFPIAPV